MDNLPSHLKTIQATKGLIKKLYRQLLSKQKHEHIFGDISFISIYCKLSISYALQLKLF